MAFPRRIALKSQIRHIRTIKGRTNVQQTSQNSKAIVSTAQSRPPGDKSDRLGSAKGAPEKITKKEKMDTHEASRNCVHRQMD